MNKISDFETNEVGIAYIAIESVLSDVTCVLGRRDKGKIHYRVIDDNGFTYGKCSSKLPLTLGELTDFFQGAWDLLEVLESNFKEDGYPREKVRAFFEASSEFYPEFGKLVEQRVEKWLQQQHSLLHITDLPHQLEKNLEALHHAVDVENGKKALEALTAVSLQMQHLCGHDKNKMRWWSAICKKLRDQVRTKAFYDAWNTVTDLLVRSRQAQDSSRET